MGSNWESKSQEVYVLAVCVNVVQASPPHMRRFATVRGQPAFPTMRRRRQAPAPQVDRKPADGDDAGLHVSTPSDSAAGVARGEGAAEAFAMWGAGW